MYRDHKTQWVLDLPYRKPPITPNSRMHWSKRHRIMAAIKASAYFLACCARIPAQEHVSFQLHYEPATVRRRDRGNLMDVHKAALDGIVKAGVVPDDNPKYVTEEMPVLHPANKDAGGRMWIVIKAVPK